MTAPDDDPLRDLALRLSKLPDARMREAVLHDHLQTLDAGQAAWLLDSLATVGRAGGPPYDVSLMAAVDLMGGERMDYSHRRAIFEAANASGLDAAKELLFSDELDSAPKAGAPRPLVPGTRPLTLGERKSLARSWDREVLERLVTDPHEDVVRLLLLNPHVTEDDVLRIATARRSSSAVLQLMLQSKRWSVRPRIRRALVRNPKLPESSALRLVGLLNYQELRDIASDPHLPPRLLAAITRRLRPPT